VYYRVDVFNPLTRTFRQEAALPTARHGIYPVVYDDKIWVAGGGTASGHSESNMVEVFGR
ncbi:MAG: hypothetical protein D6719_10480, partial [Candidatus Dadabacteria bacterium]